MRHLVRIILTLSILTSCLIGKTSTTDNDGNKIDSLKQNFKPILKGVWVLTEYINEIERTKSPLKSVDKLQDIVTLIIDGINQSDTIDVGVSWNNHEGGNFTTYFIKGQNQNQLRTNILDYDNKSNFYELGFEIINKETFLFLYHYNKTNKLINKKQFSKVAEENQTDGDAGWGIQYFVNEKLFAGNYFLIDSTNAETKVILKNDGSLTGYPVFKTYYLLTDFIGYASNIDKIIFNIDTKNSKCFAYKTEKDTTYFYNMTIDEENIEHLQLDKIQFKLVRQ
jgi:hypothetical protein